MTISLTIGRDSFKICHREGARTTVWDVHKNDPEETIVQTFQDVIGFVRASKTRAEYEGLYGEPLRGGIDPASDAGVVAQQPTNGWAAYAAPEIPEHLQGEVELIPPGEDA